MKKGEGKLHKAEFIYLFNLPKKFRLKEDCIDCILK